jgi:hypothetical protein
MRLRHLLRCLLAIAAILVSWPQLAHAETPPGPCHEGRDGEPWSDADDPGAGGDYECKKPLPGFPGAGEWGWYKVYPPYTRHPADPTPGSNGQPLFVSPSVQYETTYDAVTTYEVFVREDPARPLTLVMDYGDGSSESVTIAQGSGTTVVTFSHNFYHPEFPDGPSYGSYTQTATVLQTGFSDVSTTIHDC